LDITWEERFGLEAAEMETTLDCLAYLILHIAKVKANEAEFEIIYEQSTLKSEFKQTFFEVTSAPADLKRLSSPM